MHTFLYHLKLELYPRPPQANTDTHYKTKTVFVPSTKTDIFTASLPAHITTPWTREFIHKRSNRSISSDSGGGSPTPPTRPGSAGHTDQPGDALLLPERNAALKDTTLNIPSSPRHSPSDASKDWRSGPVSIDSIDMVPKSGPTAIHTKATYVPSDTKTTQVGWGIVHLYKDAREDVVTRKKQSPGDDELDVDKCSTLCILAVPSWMMPSDLLGFVGDQTREDVSHFRLIRTGRANKYMVLMKFRSPKKARDWQKAWNGRLFSAMEPENCHVVFVKSVQFLTPDSDSMAEFPQNNHDPFTTVPAESLSNLTSSTKPYAPPTPSLIELPTCPVCLERMDETTGLLTILCQHVFHCACLEKWRGSGCPVCRYTQSPSSVFPFPRPSDGTSNLISEDPHCSVCASTANLWICLICGSIGCGRYDSAHAYAHYEKTSHCYAMDISSQHVWDYAGDGYVHRLIQNKDQALASSSHYIDLPASRRHPNAAFRAEGEDNVPREKMEAMANEYTFLLTSQLESQRRYFEEQVQRAVDKAASAAIRAEDAKGRLEVMEEVEKQKRGLEGKLRRLEAEGDKVRLRAERFEKMARESMSGLREEKSLNQGLVERIKAMEVKEAEWDVKKKGMEGEIEDLKELNRDLTMFVEGREKLKEMEGLEEGEVEGGSMVIGKKKGKGRKR